MSLVPPTVIDFSTFTGRASNTFGPFAYEALTQATLLFYLASGIEEYPEDLQLARLAKYGILDMADKIYLSQPYKEASISPFQSETIGSYSYSRLTQAVKKGDSTGVMWFDMAVNKLKAGGTGIGASGSIQGMEWDGIEHSAEGRNRISGGGFSRDRFRNSWDIDTIEEVVHHHPIV